MAKQIRMAIILLLGGVLISIQTTLPAYSALKGGLWRGLQPDGSVWLAQLGQSEAEGDEAQKGRLRLGPVR
jgi:hypothetical protein